MCVFVLIIFIFDEPNWDLPQVNYEQVVRDTLKHIGYDDKAKVVSFLEIHTFLAFCLYLIFTKGIDYRTCNVIVAIEQQVCF